MDTHASDEASLHFGVVLHFAQSIQAPAEVQLMCLSSIALFFVNFSSSFSAIFQTVNEDCMFNATVFIGLLQGATYLPMPASLRLIRMLAFKYGHFTGFLFFAGAVFIANTSVVICQTMMGSAMREPVLLGANLLVGMGGGVLFHVRFVLSALSTCDHHGALMSKNFLASELGLSLGAILPYVASSCVGRHTLSSDAPELASSVVIASLSLVLLIWVTLRFPRRLHILTNSVRFPDALMLTQEGSTEIPWRCGLKATLLITGTMRIFVQFAAVIALALQMRDANLFGEFRQTKMAAAVFAFLAFIDAMSTLLRGCEWMPQPLRTRLSGRIVAIGLVGTVALEFCCTSWSRQRHDRDGLLRINLAAFEVVTLLVGLCAAAPKFEAGLQRLEDAEQTIVTLEWLKAYVGRLVGPIFAVAVYVFFGYDALLGILIAATIGIAVTV